MAVVKINVGEQNQACPDNHSRCIGLLAMPTSRRMSAGGGHFCIELLVSQSVCIAGQQWSVCVE